MKITYRLLKSKNACFEQVEKFHRLFPNGVEPTEALCVEHAVGVDWNWAAENLLRDAAKAKYYDICEPAWEECYRVCDLLWDKHMSIHRAEMIARDNVMDEYERICAPPKIACDRICAATFGRLAHDA